MLGKIMIKAVLVLLSFTGTEQAAVADSLAVQAQQPGSVAWGRVAMEETARRYTQANIVDYKYEGSRKLSDQQTEERFRLWLRQEGREFAVMVVIRVQTESNQMEDVSVTEIRR